MLRRSKMKAEDGAPSVEYVILIAGVGIVVLLALTLFGQDLRMSFEKGGSVLAGSQQEGQEELTAVKDSPATIEVSGGRAPYTVRHIYSDVEKVVAEDSTSTVYSVPQLPGDNTYVIEDSDGNETTITVSSPVIGVFAQRTGRNFRIYKEDGTYESKPTTYIVQGVYQRPSDKHLLIAMHDSASSSMVGASVEEYDASGVYVRSFGNGIGYQDGNIALPQSAISDEDGNVYILDFGGDSGPNTSVDKVIRIQKFAKDGTFLASKLVDDDWSFTGVYATRRISTTFYTWYTSKMQLLKDGRIAIYGGANTGMTYVIDLMLFDKDLSRIERRGYYPYSTTTPWIMAIDAYGSLYTSQNLMSVSPNMHKHGDFLNDPKFLEKTGYPPTLTIDMSTVAGSGYTMRDIYADRYGYVYVLVASSSDSKLCIYDGLTMQLLRIETISSYPAWRFAVPW